MRPRTVGSVTTGLFPSPGLALGQTKGKTLSDNILAAIKLLVIITFSAGLLLIRCADDAARVAGRTAKSTSLAKTSKATLESGMLMVDGVQILGVEPPSDAPSACSTSQACALAGYCTRKGGLCSVGSAADCAFSAGCLTHGLCGVLEQRCAARKHL